MEKNRNKMEIKLCPFFNKKYLTDLVVFAIALAIMCLALNDFDEVALIAVLVIALANVFFYPRKVTLEGEKMSIRDRYRTAKVLYTFVIRRGYGKYKKAYINIEKITKIEYISTWIEKIFNLGHMKVHGNVKMNKKNGEPIEEIDIPQTYVIYGIRQFGKLKEEIKQALPKAEHHEI